MKCPRCKTENDASASYCRACGASLQPAPPAGKKHSTLLFISGLLVVAGIICAIIIMVNSRLASPATDKFAIDCDTLDLYYYDTPATDGYEAVDIAVAADSCAYEPW